VKRLFPVLVAFNRWSRILALSFLATISAAFLLGLRIYGTYAFYQLQPGKLKTYRTCPDVTTTENNPFATLSISASISVSEVEGALKM
jgi:hypothetical protein